MENAKSLASQKSKRDVQRLLDGQARTFSPLYHTSSHHSLHQTNSASPTGEAPEQDTSAQPRTPIPGNASLAHNAIGPVLGLFGQGIWARTSFGRGGVREA